ncbi:hypothetical protein PHYBOEH_003805 [Phytophthora boehmeriae]|uniref:PX domain-containing protein n=1 Tax=Phytophthora boehmeriae TaxID=109152 RepID=A0A8T1X6D2_9STRA|nr:hypothetical protein PHYBOEH_003805 [Phytophthora boehmeriae]
MGCSQSKASEQVVERVSVDAPATEAPAPESVQAKAAEEDAAEAPPASEKATEEESVAAPASVPVEAVEEEKPAEEEPAAPDAEPEEEAPAPVEEPADEEALAVVEETVEEAAAPVEEAAATESPVDETPVEEEATPQEEAEEAAAAEEDAAPVAEESPVEEEASVEEEAAPGEVPAEEPKSEVAAAVVEHSKDDVLTFTADEVTFNKGIAYYNYDGSNPQDPAKDVRVSKRYSEFKALHAQLETLLADNQEDKAAQLPPLPKASVLRRRSNKQMIEERKAQFTALLNAIARHPVTSKSEAFANFLA